MQCSDMRSTVAAQRLARPPAPSLSGRQPACSIRRILLAVAAAVLASGPVHGGRAAGLNWSSSSQPYSQSARACATDCTIQKQSYVTLESADINGLSGANARDARGRYVVVSKDFRQLLVFDSAGHLLESPRPRLGRVVSLLVDSTGRVGAYDTRSGSLVRFDENYRAMEELDLPYVPALSLANGSFLVSEQIPSPSLVGYPLHVMSRTGTLTRSFGAGEGPFRADETLKNSRAVFLDSDGSVWSIAPGGSLLERWIPESGRRIAQVRVKSKWFQEASRLAPQGQVATPYIVTIWGGQTGGLVWILYRLPDPKWTPRVMTEQELVATDAARRSDSFLEAVNSLTGEVVAFQRFDDILLRRDGSFAIASRATPVGGARGVELWAPILASK